MICSRHIRRSFVALSVLAVAAIAPPPAPADPVVDLRIEPIVIARHRAIGSTVTVQGTVSVPTNAFDGGFAVQQGTAGIYVLDSGDQPRALGDRVEITGMLVDSSGLLAIDPASVVARGRGLPVLAVPRRTGAVGEASEGRLLALHGDMVGELFDDSPFGFILHIDDGSGPIQLFLFPGANVPTEGLHEGVAIRVVCFSNQFEATFECDPRRPEDFEVRERPHR